MDTLILSLINCFPSAGVPSHADSVCHQGFFFLFFSSSPPEQIGLVPQTPMRASGTRHAGFPPREALGCPRVSGPVGDTCWLYLSDQ